ncbi:MAG TPA: peptide chain release factor N(5)-glutamine methyltransferase [Bacteroidales bacterium]|nr:peptide chain release factor N(5)-glutamine methyltransferase [Bacteroidales bacterium]HPT11539.1 peptide chain release factor N(5)-glutamine methyltransferase [Bacteroidales bacterium]
MAEKLQTIKEILQTMSEMFGELYPAPEAKSIAALITEEFTGINRARQMIAGDQTISPVQEKNILSASYRVAGGEPLQYILGYTIFCGHRFEVNADVLIPRPETEELTSLIITENPGFKGTITDYCTGSGCIAVSLALAFPEATVCATDVSARAIETARKNALKNNAIVSFFNKDMLRSDSMDFIPCDIIVSNPPYVMEKERKHMRSNVLDHEPGLALFVPDDNPLLFYRKLAEIAMTSLSPDGKIYIEINEALGDETIALFCCGGFKDARIIKDIRGKERIITAQRNGRKE